MSNISLYYPLASTGSPDITRSQTPVWQIQVRAILVQCCTTIFKVCPALIQHAYGNVLRLLWHNVRRGSRGGHRGRTPTLFFPNSLKIGQKSLGSEPPKPLHPLLSQILDPPLNVTALNTRHWSSVGLIWGQCPRRCSNIRTTSRRDITWHRP